MRLTLTASAALCLTILCSCSSLKDHVTTGDIVAFKLRDLTRFGQPHLVKISRKEVAELEQADLKSGRMASLDSKHQFRPPVHAPVDYVLPHLPADRIVFDGSILPPKEGATTSLLRAPGFHPGARYGAASYPTSVPQNFSIE
jgi:hypothetical protein